MLPLALIAKAQGFEVSGSDRSRDQGKTPEKFTFFEGEGIELFPQDGSGLKAGATALITSTAVEDHIPDIKAAKDMGIPIIHRAAFLASLFNTAETRVAIAGTSGKTTTTGMIGYVLQELGKAPTVMNGGIFRNYSDENPYCSALTGTGGAFITEADESDGSIALYDPDIALLNNVALDHKPLEELEPLFKGFLSKSKVAVVNYDNEAARKLAEGHTGQIISFGLENDEASLTAHDITLQPDGVKAIVSYEGQDVALQIGLPGRHNLSNALAALGVLISMEVTLAEACSVLSGFRGIKRRMEVVGTKNDIIVFDDFAHNPDKISASLQSLKNFEGRLIIFFQPHGYGFLKLLHKELAESFSEYLDTEDMLLLVEPYYAGGTVDRSVTSKDVLARIEGVETHLCDDRTDVLKHILATVKAGDRIIIMGARDDTLSEFASEIIQKI